MTDPTPEQRLGQIKLDLEALYRAGRVDFPDRAEHMSGCGSALGGLMDDAAAQAAKASDITSLVFNDLESTHYLLYEAVRRCVVTLNDCAEGCLDAAALFLEQDSQAAQAHNAIIGELPALYGDGESPQAPELPTRPDPTA